MKRLAVLSILAAAGITSSADSHFSVEAFILAEPRIAVTRTDLSEAAELESIELVRGDPVSLRVVLTHSGDEPSVPSVSLAERLSPLRVIVKRPDGTSISVTHESREGVVDGLAGLAPIMPGDVQTLDTFIYEFWRTDASGTAHVAYVFDAPGTYEISVVYMIGDLAEHAKFSYGDIAEEPPTAVSETLTVNVLATTIPNWQALKDAKILRFIGQLRWPALSENAPQMESVVDAANRSWLTEWTNHIAQLSAEPK